MKDKQLGLEFIYDGHCTISVYALENKGLLLDTIKNYLIYDLNDVKIEIDRYLNQGVLK